ncbi:MAG: hypothetical protein ACR2P6_05535, partial [Gammaproteobacteria bacterium]
SFELDGQLIETRLFMHHPGGTWAGYTYEWNEAETLATRVLGGKTRQVGVQSWEYPSEGACLRCHTNVAGRSLGPETSQLNRDYTYAATDRTANQVHTLEEIGVFAMPAPGDPATLPSLPDPFGGGEFDARARSYLHTNCSFCHRPGGEASTDIDLRYTTAFADTQTCNVNPQRGDFGLPIARIVRPGDSANSVLLERVNRRDTFQMPPLASSVIDQPGVGLLRDWIDSLTGC